MMFLKLLLFFAVSVLGNEVDITRRAVLPSPPHGHWIDAWASMPQLTEPANLPPVPFNGTDVVFANSTIRQTLYMTAAASQIRLKFSNVFGGSNLPITAVTVAMPANNTAGIHQIQAKTLRKVTFSGKSSISIPNGALAVSDPVDFPIKAQQVVTVTMYLATGQTTNLITSHPGSRTTSWWQFGDAVNAAEITVSDASTQSAAHWYFLSSIEAWVPREQGSLLIVGDSITDGRGSTTNANNRWPDLLLARLQQGLTTRRISIGNLAAGGNRVLADGLGPNALGRIDRDVLAHPGVQYAMIFEGVNDIGTAATTANAQDDVYEALTQAYEQMVTLIHAHGIPVFGATITPFSAPSNFTGQPYSSPEREATRQKVNSFIRDSGTFDAVVDFDKLLADPEVPSRLKAEYDSGDYLHPNVQGYQHLADQFPVAIFEQWAGGVVGSAQPHLSQAPTTPSYLTDLSTSPRLHLSVALTTALSFDVNPRTHSTTLTSHLSLTAAMQLTTLLLAATSALSVSAGSSWITKQVTVKEDYKVPGDNPLYFCEDPANNILSIEKVDLDPNPPKPGSTLSIKAEGNFKEEVGEGFKMHLQVKYGLITLINQQADGCETIQKGDLECPLEKGEMTLTKDVDLPREIPPGTYTVLADVYTADGDKITCLTAKIAFHRTGDGGVKIGKRRVEMSGPAAKMVQERLRLRNEL
ncbi:SGNH hydrolase [Dothidotthia symphoricarpi CBS 119687]|uniref:Phosphatidylglycerol/phosphatidylinositol transfer protein n=1 Tax=Dothidotthia symphoricarpi CBS 119687 TaxID=1392245 RepID=A0A6A6A1T6_9PLEO|nr:SGNH hydrolase [Dothidotthia symphoricarpi CBS 119687]KAF2124907.1 SGNH hydrolase [Dothidotthia symphoricarpi CBS 119687]